LSLDLIEISGKVTDVLPGSKFKIELINGKFVEGHLSGKLRQNFIKIIPGDTVLLEVSKYDLTKGRIIYRGEKK
jgi:translation initiation factor IF-1